MAQGALMAQVLGILASYNEQYRGYFSMSGRVRNARAHCSTSRLK
jgi:hypothetical protein